MTISKPAFYLGLGAGIVSIALWVIFNFYNPYSNSSGDTVTRTFIMLVLPAVAAITAVLLSIRILMMIAFLWSLPISLYLSLASISIFSILAVACALYLVSYLLMKAKAYQQTPSK
ncbi:hypothetical protein ACFPYJ_05175 [Paenibacillus solisilvae]|uniref:Uncharacterized protein n=1 Tax=Paenibacillus solisilvae TaxID=2486751 RepID=A0ABW0VU65_9BACL